MLANKPDPRLPKQYPRQHKCSLRPIMEQRRKSGHTYRRCQAPDEQEGAVADLTQTSRRAINAKVLLRGNGCAERMEDDSIRRPGCLICVRLGPICETQTSVHARRTLAHMAMQPILGA